MPVLQQVDSKENQLRLDDIVFPDLDSLDQVGSRVVLKGWGGGDYSLTEFPLI